MPRLFLAVGLIVVCAGHGQLSPAIGQRPVVSQYEVKAALLLNFARFTDWPGTVFPTSSTPFVVGVVGRDPFGPILEKTFSNKTVANRSVVVKRLNADDDLKQCHLLFVSASEKRRQRDLLEKVKGASILTIGESEDFLDHGGAVQLLLKDDLVRFSVNLHAGKAALLRINSNVLKLAVAVRGKYE